MLILDGCYQNTSATSIHSAYPCIFKSFICLAQLSHLHDFAYVVMYI